MESTRTTNTSQLHVILGASGAMGRAVVAALQENHLPIRAVERSKDVPGVDTVRADLLDPLQTKQAIAGASHVYVCVGLPYNAQIWQGDWPVIMRNIIDACAEHDAAIIFLDNIYMYGPAPLQVPFDESHPQDPPSIKGKVRKEVADMMLAAFADGGVRGVIGRAADFYGPGAVTSAVYISLLQRMLAGKRPQWLGSARTHHTYSYTPDNGRALVALALDDSTYGQVWHLPVGEPVTVADLVGLLNTELGTSLKPAFVPRATQSLLGLFMPVVREAAEMSYQFYDEYVMNDQKFMHHFPDFARTPYAEGLTETVRSFRP